MFTRKLVLICSILFSGITYAADEQKIIFTNVNVFDGKSDKLIENAHVLVSDNLITKVSKEPIAPQLTNATWGFLLYQLK